MPQETSSEGHGTIIGISVFAGTVVVGIIGVWLYNRGKNSKGVHVPQETRTATSGDNGDNIQVTETFDRNSERMQLDNLGQASSAGQPMGVTGNQSTHQVYITGGANNHQTGTSGNAATTSGSIQATQTQPFEVTDIRDDNNERGAGSLAEGDASSMIVLGAPRSLWQETLQQLKRWGEQSRTARGR